MPGTESNTFPEPDKAAAYEIPLSIDPYQEAGSRSETPLLAGEPMTPSPTIHPEVQRAQEAFRRDLPQLLENKKLYRKWVAYRGDERIGIARSEDELYEECTRRGLQDHEYIVGCIVPEISRDLDATPPFNA